MCNLVVHSLLNNHHRRLKYQRGNGKHGVSVQAASCGFHAATLTLGGSSSVFDDSDEECKGDCVLADIRSTVLSGHAFLTFVPKDYFNGCFAGVSTQRSRFLCGRRSCVMMMVLLSGKFFFDTEKQK